MDEKKKYPKFYAEFECIQDSVISDRCGPWHFEIPGKHTTKELAMKEYQKYEDKLKQQCKNEYPVYMFREILDEQELNKKISNLRLIGHNKPTILTIQSLEK